METLSVTHHEGRQEGTARAHESTRKRPGTFTGIMLALFIVTIMLPVTAGAVPDNSDVVNASSPQVVKIGIDIMDFNTFDVAEGRAEADFYLSLKSDTPVSISDVEIVNGRFTSVDTLVNSTYEKTYRVFAIITADPNLRQFPFDKHTLPLMIESKNKDTTGRVLVIDTPRTGIEPEADLPGWEFTRQNAYTMNKSYDEGAEQYSRAVFTQGIMRDTASTLLKFFLPIMLIVMVSLASLMMKVSSRLGLNASMFLAAVLIHWRVADAIPLVAYATFLDIFMIITYGTLVMVLISGILIMKFSETKDTARIELVNYWSLRIIPTISLGMYLLLFLTLLT